MTEFDFAPNNDPSEDVNFQPTPPETDEATRQLEAQAPDVGESLRQMQATLNSMASRLPEEEADDEDGYGVVADYDQQEMAALAEQSGLLDDDEGGDIDDAELDDLIDARVQQAVIPLAAEFEIRRREEQILALADRYPRLNEPEVQDFIEDRLERMAEAHRDPSILSDPAHIRDQYLIFEAERVAAAETPADAGPAGATLEVGAGPSGSQGGEEIDPATKSYLDAIAGSSSPNAFTR